MPQQVACPICKKMTRYENNPYRPFCSKRCRMLDLGAWANEEYAVKGEKAGEDELDDEIKPEA